MTKHLIFDFNGIFCPIYFVKKESLAEATEQLINTIISLLRPYKNSQVLFACDMCKNNYRYSILDSYKASRADNPLLKDSLIKVQNLFQAYNLPMEGNDIYEADDIIASYCNVNENTVIFGIDKDYYQLINSNTLIFHPFKRIFIDEQFVKDKFNVLPDKFALFQALCGDKSDNIPGIKNVGPKTAANIINSCSDYSLFQTQFPKYDFSNIEQMLELTRLKVFNINNQHKSAEEIIDILVQMKRDLVVQYESVENNYIK